MGSLQSLVSGSPLSRESVPRLNPGTWDTHVHIFDTTIGPFAPDRDYTPAEAHLSDLLKFSHTLTRDNSSTNLVLVQPSPYGTDNTVLLETLRQLRGQSQLTARGIAVVDVEDTSDEQFRELHDSGIRGLRLNKGANEDEFSSVEFAKNISKAADRIKNLPGWKLQLYISGNTWDDLFDTLVDLPVEIIADHLGGMKGSSKLDSTMVDARKQPGFESLLKLAERSRVYLKISALYRASSRNETGYDDLEPIIRTFAAKVPNRLIYASDWPHTGDAADRTNRDVNDIEEFRTIDNAQIVARLKGWIQSEEKWSKMLVTTPGRIFQ